MSDTFSPGPRSPLDPQTHGRMSLGLRNRCGRGRTQINNRPALGIGSAQGEQGDGRRVWRTNVGLLPKQRRRACWGATLARTQRLPGAWLAAKPRSMQLLLEASTMPYRDALLCDLPAYYLTCDPSVCLDCTFSGSPSTCWEQPTRTWLNKQVNGVPVCTHCHPCS